MKKRKLNPVKVGVALAILVIICLTAFAMCHPKEKKSSIGSTTTTSSQVKKKQATSSSTTKESSTEAKAATSTEASQEASSNPSSAKAEGIDPAALAKGDYSSVVGTWSTYGGTRLVFDKKGLLALIGGDGVVEKKVRIFGGSVEENRFSASVGGSEPILWGAAISFVPAGTPTAGDKIVYQQDCIIIAQAINGEYEPFYKVSDSTDVPESVSPKEPEQAPVEEAPAEEEATAQESSL